MQSSPSPLALPLLGMNQKRVRAGFMIGLCALESLDHAAAGNKGFDPRNDAEIVVDLTVLAGLDLAAEFVDVGQRLTIADEGICFGKQLVLDADTGDAALAKLADEADVHMLTLLLRRYPGVVERVALSCKRDCGDVKAKL